MRDGYVALIDVLGFKSLISADGSNERLSEYLNCLNESVSRDTSAGLEVLTFSDTIVITTADGAEPSLKGMAWRCARLFSLLLAHGFPVRGAISYGSYCRVQAPGGTFVAGRAIVDAYTFEQAQNWVGIMLAPSVMAQNPQLAQNAVLDPEKNWTVPFLDDLDRRKNRAATIQPCLIPWRNGSEYEGYAVLPVQNFDTFRSIANSLASSMAALSRMRELAPDPRSQSKYLVSISWIKRCLDKWDRAVTVSQDMRGR